MICLGDQSVKKNGNKVYVVAEIGQNHQGDLDIAKRMILEAKNAGCDCVKFQKSCLSEKFTKSALNRKYDGIHSWGKTYGEHKLYLEFTEMQYIELKNFCHNISIDFAASAMDEVSLNFLDTLNVPFIKIGSGDANNFPLLQKASKYQRTLIISTGMQTEETIDEIVNIMGKNRKQNFALFHCVSSYPTKAEDAHLKMIRVLSTKYPNIVIGYSGHEEGIEITKAAVLLGAKIIERHVTLNKTQKGSDHKCSLEFTELKRLIEDINRFGNDGLLDQSPLKQNEIFEILHFNTKINLALKNVAKRSILPCELNCKHKLGKSLVASRLLKKGIKITRQDICVKVSEPNGIPAENYNSILGIEILCDVEMDMPILYEHIYM